MWRGFLIFSLILLFLNPGATQSGKYTFFHTTYTTDNGLSSRFVRDIYQDTRRFLWIATDYGINKFDGNQFTDFSQVNASFQSDNINHIREDQQGNLWLIDNKDEYLNNVRFWKDLTVDIFDPLTGTAQSFNSYVNGKAPFSLDMITLIVQDDKQRLWISTRKGELYVYEDEFVQYPIPEHLQDNAVFYPLADDEVMVSMKGKLVRLKKEGTIVYSTPFDRKVHNVMMGHQGEVYISSYRGFNLEAHKLNESGVLEEIDNGLEKKGSNADISISRFGVDHYGRMWIGEDKGGKLTVKIDGKRVENHELDKIILENGLVIRHNFKSDKDGGIWYSDRIGLNYMSLNPVIFQVYFDRKPISIRAMFPLDDSTFLANTYNGYFKIDIESGYYEPFKIDESISISQDGVILNGTLYNSCYDGKVYKIDLEEQTSKEIEITEASVNTNTFVLSPDSTLILIGTSRGLYWLDIKQDSIVNFEQYNDFPELAKLQINSFHTLDDDLYLLTERGMYLMDWQSGIQEVFHFSFDNLFHLHRDEDGYFWIATRGGGLIKWKPGIEARRFTTEDGLTHGTVYAVYPDYKGNLWLPSSKGLMCFNVEKETIHAYFEENGLPVNEFNQYAHLDWKDGSLLFGGLNGVIRFYPEELLEMRQKSEKSPLVITECNLLNDDDELIKINPATLAIEVPLELGPNIKTAVIKFSLLEFDQKVPPRYAYKIVGIDQQWNYLKENVVRINRLPPGSYTLQLRGEAGMEAYEQEMKIPIVFNRSFTESWLFFGLCALGFVIIGISLSRYRLYRLDILNQRLDREVQVRIKKIEQDKILISRQYREMEKLNQTKDRLIAIIGHDLKDYVSAFQGIEKKVNYLLTTRQLKRIPKLAEYIENSAHDLSLLLDNLLNWALKERGDLRLHPDWVNVHFVLEEVIARLNKFVIKKEILLSNNIPEDLVIYVDNLTLDILLRNMIHNAIKFSHRGGKIEISHSFDPVDPDLVQIHIRDYGLGMSDEQKERLFTQHDYSLSTKGTENEGGTGMGLILCRELLQIQSGKLTVRSEEGSGTTFSINLPHKILTKDKIEAL